MHGENMKLIDDSLVAAIWMRLSWTSIIQPWLCTIWLPSSGPSEEASLWSRMPNLPGSAQSCLTVVPFAKPSMLCWRHSFTDNTLTNAWTFGLTMREGRSLFSSLQNISLNKKFSISKYSLLILTFWLTYINPQKKVLREKVSITCLETIWHKTVLELNNKYFRNLVFS